MKAYKIVLGIIDFEEMGEHDIKRVLEDVRYLSPKALRIESREIGEWSDDHPLNISSIADAEWQRIFATKGENE